MTEEAEHLEIGGIDFSLAISSVAHGPETNVRLLTGHEKDINEWQKKFSEISDCEGISFKCLFTPSVLDLTPHLEEAHLFVAPLKPDSTLFGVEALSAIAAGVPILVSENCGVVPLLKSSKDSAIHENTAQGWNERITNKLRARKEAQVKAKTLREELLLDTKITESQLDACQIICGKCS